MLASLSGNIGWKTDGCLDRFVIEWRLWIGIGRSSSKIHDPNDIQPARNHVLIMKLQQKQTKFLLILKPDKAW